MPLSKASGYYFCLCIEQALQGFKLWLVRNTVSWIQEVSAEKQLLCMDVCVMKKLVTPVFTPLKNLMFAASLSARGSYGVIKRSSRRSFSWTCWRGCRATRVVHHHLVFCLRLSKNNVTLTNEEFLRGWSLPTGWNLQSSTLILGQRLQGRWIF